MDYIGYYPLDRLTGRHIGIDPGQWHGFVIIMKDLNNNYPWGLCCWTVATSKAGNNDALKHIIQRSTRCLRHVNKEKMNGCLSSWRIP